MSFAKKIINYIYSQHSNVQNPTAVMQLPEPEDVKINNDYNFMNQIEKVFNKIADLNTCNINPTYLKDIIETLKGLIIVINDLKKESENLEIYIKDADEIKNKLNNHNSIIQNLQQMYQTRMQQLKDHYDDVIVHKDEIIRAHEQKIADISKTLVELEQKQKNLGEQNKKQSKHILELNQQNQKMYVKLSKATRQIESYSMAKNSLIYDNLSKLNPIQLLFQSSITQHIINFLDVEDIFNIGLVNKKTNFIVRNDYRFAKCLLKKVQVRNQRFRKDVLKELVQYQNVIEAFPMQNIRQSALKYLYFKIKPGEYMINLFSTFKGQEYKNKPVPQRKSSIFNIFAKQQKKQQSKFSLRDLVKQDYYKKVEKKIDEYFGNVFQISNSKCLSQFRDTMIQQFKQLKQTLMNDNQVSQLFSYSRFLYIQTQQMHKLVMCLFSLALDNIKKYDQIHLAYQDIKQSRASMHNVLSQLSEEKNQMQQNNWKLEIEYKKYKNQNKQLLVQFERLTKEYSQIKLSEESLNKLNQINEKKLEELKKKCKNYEKQFQALAAIMDSSK